MVRAVAREDWNQWLPFCDGYNAFYGREGPTALPLEITMMTWAQFFDAYEPVHALVVERDRELVGLTHYLFYRSTIQIDPSCCLQDVFTLPDVNGQGVGRAVIEAVYERALPAGVNAERGSTQPEFQTHPDFAVALNGPLRFQNDPA